MKKTLCKIFLLSVAIGMLGQPIISQAKENVVVMIDPGHGGTNLGANPTGYVEKDMTLITALAMKEELEKYQGVSVYLTRNSDVELSLQDRAQMAKNVNADFLYSLHYNMSANHVFYGAEIWAQSMGTNYAKGYSQGQLLLSEFITVNDIFSRGVKVQVGKSGNEYYGILRYASKLDLPAVIVEHCHLDQAFDAEHFNTVDKLKQFGRSDATAVAKYFGLASTSLKVDYSHYPKPNIEPPTQPKTQDLTPPELATLQVTEVDSVNKTVSIQINATDRDTGIMYYSYSTDGGATFEPLQIWPSATDTLTIRVPAKFGQNRSAIAAVFNCYDGMALSSPVNY